MVCLGLIGLYFLSDAPELQLPPHGPPVLADDVIVISDTHTNEHCVEVEGSYGPHKKLHHNLLFSDITQPEKLPDALRLTMLEGLIDKELSCWAWSDVNHLVDNAPGLSSLDRTYVKLKTNPYNKMMEKECSPDNKPKLPERYCPTCYDHKPNPRIEKQIATANAFVKENNVAPDEIRSLVVAIEDTLEVCATNPSFEPSFYGRLKGYCFAMYGLGLVNEMMESRKVAEISNNTIEKWTAPDIPMGNWAFGQYTFEPAGGYEAVLMRVKDVSIFPAGTTLPQASNGGEPRPTKFDRLNVTVDLWDVRPQSTPRAEETLRPMTGTHLFDISGQARLLYNGHEETNQRGEKSGYSTSTDEYYCGELLSPAILGLEYYDNLPQQGIVNLTLSWQIDGQFDLSQLRLVSKDYLGERHFRLTE